MALRRFFSGSLGIRTRQIDFERGRIKAALLEGYTFTPGHRTLADIVRAGGAVLSVATIDTAPKPGEGDTVKLTTQFCNVPPGAEIGCVVFFQSSGRKADPDAWGGANAKQWESQARTLGSML